MRWISLAWLLLACSAPGRVRREVPIGVPALPASGGSDDVTWILTAATVELGDLELRTESAVAWQLPSLVGVALAHPGHDPGTSVVGELTGMVTVDLLAGGTLGEATVLDGTVATADFLLGEVHLSGSAMVDQQQVPFDLQLDVDAAVIGASAALTVDPDAPPTGWQLHADLHAALAGLPWPADHEGTWTLRTDAELNVARFQLRQQDHWSIQETP